MTRAADPRRRLAGRFALVPGQHRPHRVRDGAIFLAVVGFLLVAGFGRGIPFWPDGRATVTADFAQAVSLREGAPVRVAGVDVGTVDGVDLGPGGRGARVTMKLDDDQEVDVRRDARAHLFWRTLLGRNMYVQLDPGTAGAPALGDDVLPASRTTAQVEVDQVLHPLDDGGRRALQVTTREFERGFAQPSAVQDTIDALPSASDSLAGGVSALRGSATGDLTRLVRSTSRALRALAADDDALAGTVEGAEVVLGVTAARRADLAGVLDRAPAAERRTITTMARLRGTLGRLDPLAAQLRPGARRLDDAVGAVRPALDVADPLLRRARPLLSRLRPAVADLGRAGTVGVPLFDALDPTLDRSLDRLLPWLQERDDETKLRNLEAIGPWFSGADAIASRFDANGYVLRMQPGASLQSIDSLPCQLYLTDPTAPQLARCSALKQALGAVLGGGRRR
ncbi:MlaD family protein [Conexibacter sp. SYSU D00693]|uniref:MlaD family protein n=1 Tax=Conexibacter sp. SYSU D00693 TaxID=2812560 RepID=UPI00196A9B5E|nr:MlaD family protein [Conexibacter sp. SYSU D00693]